MDARIQLIPEPLRAIEIVGCDGPDAQSMAEVVQLLGVLLMRTHPVISLEHIERLVVAVNYPLALQRYRAQGETFAADFMQTAGHAEGLAFATERGVIVIVGGDAVLGSLDTIPSKATASARVVVHELCHGHDLGKLHPWLWAASQKRAPDDEATLYWLCYTMWSEYFANRYSYFCNPSLADEWTRLELLFDHLPSMNPSQAAKTIALTFGYALGSLAAEGATLQDLRPDLTQRLRACGLWAAWFEASTVTEQLAQTGECWQHAGGLLRLTTAARLIISACRYGLR
jgi:hypothetical protein